MNSKLISNIFLGVIGALALCLILLAIIPKSYNIGISNEPYKITVYDGSVNNKYECSNNASETQKKNYNQIGDLYNKMFSTSSLNALFSRILFYAPYYDYEYSRFSSLVSNNSYVIEFTYNDMQTLYKDGKPYTNPALNGSSYVDNIATFQKVWIVINEFDGFGKITFYFENLDNTGYSIIKVETLGNTHELNKFLSELDYNNNDN